MRRLFGIFLAVFVCASLPAARGQAPVPGVIQAEDYDSGGEGAGYHDSDLGNNGNSTYRNDDVDIEYGAGAVNGNNIGWIVSGEWLDFTVNVATSATYQVRYRVASNVSGPFMIQLSVDGVQADEVSFDGTAGWQNWVPVSSPAPFTLNSGTHTVRLDFLGTEFNFDEFEFSLAGYLLRDSLHYGLVQF